MGWFRDIFRRKGPRLLPAHPALLAEDVQVAMNESAILPGRPCLVGRMRVIFDDGTYGDWIDVALDADSVARGESMSILFNAVRSCVVIGHESVLPRQQLFKPIILHTGDTIDMKFKLDKNSPP